MGIYGIMNTSVSGMNAQANKLSTVADNIANVNTNGYKAVSTSFSSMVVNSSSSSYDSGSVKTTIQQSVSKSGSANFTQTSTNMSVAGSGFFIVNDSNGGQYLTRAGDFVFDRKRNLVNAAGFYLQGYPVDDSGKAGTTLANVNVSNVQMEAQASKSATLNVNLPDTAAVDDIQTTSLKVYDNLGNEETLTFEYKKKTASAGGTTDPVWELTVTPPGTSQDLTFDKATGKIKTASSTMTIALPGGRSVDIDMAGSSQLAADFSVIEAKKDGTGPSSVSDVRIDDEGTLFAVYSNGEEKAVYKIPLGNVANPDKLTLVSGNSYRVNNDAGVLRVVNAGSGGTGKIAGYQIEGSNVDLASELTSMIQSQRSYTANSKVFTASSEILQVLVNLR
ncbi:flagellar hook protein FlgE [Polycladidibacter stylochi]|uniref:flagellar hook protein FlgE n=1 Tax=Polycladidibacter stylochi TaxID=1807766 RepID=UPI00082D218C|nr:flagellar hook protein FlgE [Pseudovibrio stylochi]